MSHNLRRSLSAGPLLPFDSEIEKTCRRNSKETRQRTQSSRVEQPSAMAEQVVDPQTSHAPIATHERQNEPLVNPPRQAAAPTGPRAPVEQQGHVVHQPLNQRAVTPPPVQRPQADPWAQPQAAHRITIGMANEGIGDLLAHHPTPHCFPK
ncbi:hypothetical protein Syun_017617 [Stephania yunnanensis]|uniref:Uncharacterized protein n=1 Tax=Stephania yunnanensis TaxID=152371 RepID=A0AAP0J8Y6_9MAGN